MRVLFQSRKTLFSVPGGDTVQMLKTKEHLLTLGVQVDISTELEANVSSYDLVHVFNLMRPQEAYLQVRNAKNQKKPVALSTIYGLYAEYDSKARSGLAGMVGKHLSSNQREYFKVAARALLNGELHKGTYHLLINGYQPLLKQICAMVDIFLPNSESEMIRVAKDIGLSNYQYRVIPNAVDQELFDYERVTSLSDAEKYRGCVLCVGRIEGRKNQLNLVRAMKGLPWQLVLIGKPAPNHASYYKQVLKDAGQNVAILGQVPHEQLPIYYKAAKVHVLASWMETPGLSSLEAAAMGCNIVVTDRGDVADYFGKYAKYCEPDSIDSIRHAINEAYTAPDDDSLRKHIEKNYTWSIASKQSAEAYSIVLNN